MTELVLKVDDIIAEKFKEVSLQRNVRGGKNLKAVIDTNVVLAGLAISTMFLYFGSRTKQGSQP